MTEHPFGYIIEGKIYLKGFLGQEDRVIGEVKEDEASTFRYFEDRFEAVKQKVEKLKSDIEENQNKGSFLMKLIHLKSSLLTFDGLGDFPALIKELEGQEAILEEIIQSNRHKNLEIKKELLEEAETYKESTDWKETSEIFKELKLKWLKTGPVEKELEEEINEKFQDILDVFYGNRKNYFDGLALQAEQNIKVYENLLEQAREAHDMADVKTAFEISKKIQKEWKVSGRVPASKRQPIWDEFSKLNNRIFSKFKRMSQSIPTISPGLMIKKIDKWSEEMRQMSKGEVDEYKVNHAKKLQAEWKKLPPKKPRNAQQSIGTFVFFSEIIFEKSFLDNLCHSKYEGFAEKTDSEQNTLKVNLLKDLIARDQRELITVTENAENFRSQEGEFDHIMRKKIGAHKRKVDVKNSILKELTNN
ncbi:DUF349 domain-containing protein [Cyclobacterium qasimii]|uniref:ATPase involved in DNA repair n=2 Tax=Cyclobacterium qasimii TaxID=1350429 RepID=S7VA32_9BACT|nr:DUF349 domain-containing protein [Cyclobacterium qasimii]EPR66786.1 ATPase involved in DNA repair [Cyclobacterium qasimii M12-11B]GEO21676.1 hypothetical protein CQA01_22100 [Cyclobacterium qasimii]